MRNKLTSSVLQTLVSYDRDTGVFLWLPREVTNYHVRTWLHRLAWLYVYGQWPSKQIDHINGNKVDNRIKNLREATHSQNMKNRGPGKDNTSGYLGVSWDKRSRKWHARMVHDGKRINLGYFVDKTLAAKAYEVAAKFYRKDFARIAA